MVVEELLFIFRILAEVVFNMPLVGVKFVMMLMRVFSVTSLDDLASVSLSKFGSFPAVFEIVCPLVPSMVTRPVPAAKVMAEPGRAATVMFPENVQLKS